MARLARGFRRKAGDQGSWQRIVMVAMPLAALALVLLPQSATDRIRVWAGPVFSPFQDLTQGWSLAIAERIRNPGGATQAEGPPLAEQVARLQNALAEATGLLNEYDQRVRDLTRLRQDLGNLPCRLVPARLIPPEVAGGQTSARLGEGTDRGIRKGGAVVCGRIDRGAREAIQKGEPVLTASSLVGIVSEVGPLTSTVRLVTDPRTAICVQVITRRDGRWRAGPEGVARGTQDGTAITVQGISRTSDVAPGDFVVTSPSPESGLPPYLVVGRVVQCDLKPAALFYTLVVEPRVAPADAREVYVLSPETGGAAGR